MTLSMGIGLQGLRRLSTGTAAPPAALAIELSGPIHAFILKAANGIRYRIRVEHDGILSISPVS